MHLVSSNHGVHFIFILDKPQLNHKQNVRITIIDNAIHKGM